MLACMLAYMHVDVDAFVVATAAIVGVATANDNADADDARSDDDVSV